MKHILKIIPWLIGASVFSSASIAADLGARKRTAATTPVSETISWGGFYVGGNVGGSFLNASFTDRGQWYHSNDPGYTAAESLGISAGVGLGYNYLIGSNGLVGLDADVNLSNLKAKHFLPLEQTQPGLGSTYKAETASFMTVRGRAGLTFGSTLLYGTAGLAFMDQKQEFIQHLNSNSAGRPAACGSGSTCINKKATGLVLGGGAEFAINKNWHIKAEYLNINLPASDTYPVTGQGATTETVAFKNRVQLIRAGFNYYFN